MKEKTKKIIAWIALFCIIASVVGTGIMVIFGGKGNDINLNEINKENIYELEEILKNQSGSTSTGEIIESEILLGDFKDLNDNIIETGTGTQE